MFRGLVLVVAACALPAFAAAPVATLTVVEGEAHVIRGSTKLSAPEGMRIEQADIVETAGNGFAQIEAPDGARIELGPLTRLAIGAMPPAGKRRPADYLLAGWVKITARGKSAGADIVLPGVGLSAIDGVMVIEASPGVTGLYAESGTAAYFERVLPQGGKGALLAGDFYERRGSEAATVQQRPAPAFVKSMPKPFMDTLPSRLDRWRERSATAKPLPPFTYQDVEPWLKAEPAIRRQFPRRWQPRASDAAFRAALVANVRAHPEWEPILFPPPPQPRSP